MRGHKWDVCRHAVIDFIKYLNEYDIVSSIVFNDYAHLVMHWATRQSQTMLGQLTNYQPLQQALVNEPFFDPNEFTQQQQQQQQQMQMMYQNPFNNTVNQQAYVQPNQVVPSKSDLKSQECCNIM